MKNIFCNFLEVKPIEKEILMGSDFGFLSNDILDYLIDDYESDATTLLLHLIKTHNDLVNQQKIKRGEPFYCSTTELADALKLGPRAQLWSLNELSEANCLNYVLLKDGELRIVLYIDKLNISSAVWDVNIPGTCTLN